MKNWVQYKEKCTGDRPEVCYKSQFIFCPEPQIAIALSEIMHDTGMSARALICELLGFALNYAALETKTIKRLKLIVPGKEAESDE